MIWTLIGLLILFWFLGLLLDIGGAVIHVLLVIAVIVFIFNLITGRRRK
ncbi:MAG TPA: lmo0937 family membrane protein [Atopostipes sp.]|jgi:predicted membrane metal-binding protein|nr:lmo0937 family membrane protein [Atopostipes sp.]